MKKVKMSIKENSINDEHVTKIDLAVCILFYEKLDQTIECIQSFVPSGVNIYILNNGSSPSSRQAIGRFCSPYNQIKISDLDINLGVGVGRNYLVTHTIEEWMLFVDNDIVIKTPDWLQKFIQQVSLHNDIEVFIPKLFNAQKKSYSSYMPFRIVGDVAIRDKKVISNLTNNFPGGASFINRKLFNRLGLYDDKMFVGLEDYELCIRGICLGEPVKACHIYDIKLLHSHHPLKKNEDRDAVLMRYDVKYIEDSFNRIMEKYNIILEGNWKIWSAEQAEKMVKNGNFTCNENWKQRVSNQILKLNRDIVVSSVSSLLPYPVKRILKKTLLRQRAIPNNCSLYMTDRCNFKCPGCRRNVIRVKKSNDMTLVTLQKLLSLYPSLDAFCVAGLGEPTLCPNFVDIVNFLKKSGKFVGLITNCMNVDKLLELSYEPNYISISLKGYDNKSYVSNTGVDAYDTVIAAFLKLKQRFKNVGFSYILNRANYKDLDKVLPICDDLKLDFLRLTNYLVYNPTVTEEVQKIITVKNSEIIDYINEACERREYIRVKPTYVDFENPKFNCKSYDYMINLDGDGNIGGCQRQVPPDTSFGNIFTDKDPYHSLEMSRLRDLLHRNSYIHKECRFCFGNWE
jgi:MoaA/NifB/PqqE/SkfB family radical SAM enzyme/GT2 family glycosyltransferase